MGVEPCLISYCRGHSLHFVYVYHSALETVHRDSGREEAVTLAGKLLRSRGIEYHAGIHPCGYLEGYLHREVGAYETGNDICGRTLGGDDHIDAAGAALLGEAHYGGGYASGACLCLRSVHRHYQVGILVYDHDQIRQEVVSFGREKMAMPVFLIICLDLIDTGLAEQGVAVVHLDAEGPEGGIRQTLVVHYDALGLLLGIGCSRNGSQIVMQELAVGGELDLLRIHEHEFELGRMLGVEKG